jgi:hypothetical protein
MNTKQKDYIWAAKMTLDNGSTDYVSSMTRNVARTDAKEFRSFTDVLKTKVVKLKEVQ